MKMSKNMMLASILMIVLCLFAGKYYVSNLPETIEGEKKITIFELARLYCEQYSNTNDIFTSLKNISKELSANDEIIFLSFLILLFTKLKSDSIHFPD